MCRRRRVLSRTCEFAADCVYVCFLCSLCVCEWLNNLITLSCHQYQPPSCPPPLFRQSDLVEGRDKLFHRMCHRMRCDVDGCCMKIERDLTLTLPLLLLLQLLLSERLELNVDTVGMGNLINMCRRRRVLLRTCEFAGDCVFSFVFVCLCVVQQSDYYFVSSSHRHAVHAVVCCCCNCCSDEVLYGMWVQ
jgi:hypothetical protein